MTGNKVEVEDVQGLVVSAYPHLKHSRFLFLRFGSGASAARLWLAALVDQVTTAGRAAAATDRLRAGGDPSEALPWALQISLSRAGLSALGLDEEALKTFSPEFYEGMAGRDRSKALGDRGDSAPKRWEVGAKGNEAQALLMLYARDAKRLKELGRKQEQAFRKAGMRLVHAVEGARTPDEKEHFGFRDGISQPRIRGLNRRRSSRTNMVRPGEFIFGYKDEAGRLPQAPCVPAKLDPSDLLPPSPAFKGWKDLGRNGSYLVFRKLSQDVPGFWRYFREQARRSGAEPGNAAAMGGEAVKLAAKCMGRWPSGAPLVLSPDRDDAGLGGAKRRNNAFLYHQADPDGLRCPVASHIRRANPRDSLTAAFVPDPSDPRASLMVSNRHRILRRGRPYGSFLKDPLARRKPAGDRGLLFFCLNTDLARQFEFIQQMWLNSPKFDGLSHEGDPIGGANDGVHDGKMVIPALPLRRRLHGLPRFVQVRGGAYLFLPGVRALRFLSREPGGKRGGAPNSAE